MNNISDTDVLVHSIEKASENQKAGERALLWFPSMRLFEEPSTYLHRLTTVSKSKATWRNNAYALAYWHSYCIAAGIDWRNASNEDLVNFGDAMENAISTRGTPFAAGTIRARQTIVIDYYVDSAKLGWYEVERPTRDQLLMPQPVKRGRVKKTIPLAHLPITSESTRFLSRQTEVEGPVSPFSVSQLREFLKAAGPSYYERGVEDHRSCRDRLMIDWMWAVGLRISELISLRLSQFLSLVFNPKAEVAQVSIEVIGKGNKRRKVGVPIWLINDTLEYIRSERAGSVKAGQGAEPLVMFVSHRSSSKPGRPLTARRVQDFFKEYCFKAGLTQLVSFNDQLTGKTVSAMVAIHHPHDLRHTYAVLTYWTEKANGNSEPWKKIQAQLGHARLETTIDTYLEHVDAYHEFGTASIRETIGLPIQNWEDQ